MALFAVEALLHKARNASQEDVDQLCRNISDLLAFPEKSAECCALLRQLFVLLQASEVEPCLPRSLLTQLMRALSQPVPEKGGGNLCLLCCLLLKELLPGSKQTMEDVLPSAEKPAKKSLLACYALQGSKNNCVQEVLPSAVRWLCTKDLDSQRKALSFLVAVSCLHGIVTQEQVGETSEQLCSWLMNASLFQAPNPHSFNPFRKDQENQVTEIDGTPCRYFFTVLNVGQYYTDDQYLNIYSFSLLYKWLYHSSRQADSRRQAEAEGTAKNRASGQMDSVRSKVLQSLVTRSVDYCFRAMDQCERKVKVASDAELQLACLTEIVTILDLVCKLDGSQIPRVHQEMRRLYTRLTSDPTHSVTILRILQFFLNHSSAVVHDPQEAYSHYFGTVLSQQYKDPGIAFDTVVFWRENLASLCYSTNILSHFFPNILKILAWHPQTFVKEFVDLLPAMMSPTTSLEVFHTLLDLPCLTAALEVCERSKKFDPSTINSQNSSVEPASSVEAFHTPRFKPLFSFITRSEGGQGDTINRLSSLHRVLEDAKTSARVVSCSQVVPLLLRVWFNVVLEEGEQSFVEQVLPVLLERSAVLYDIADCKADVVMIMGEELLRIVEKYPSIMVSQASDIMEFVNITNNMRHRQDFYANLIYCIGEHCSSQRTVSCSPELVAQYFDMLEVVTYEICGRVAMEEELEVHPKILCHLMAAMAKLASRRQDLIPRAILCLTKVSKQHFTLTQDPLAQEALLACAQEHINLLKMPSFAVTVLNPPPEIYTGRWHRDAASLPRIVRGMHRVMNGSA